MQRAFEERLKKALAGRSAAQMNEFQFLNLEMVKAETGDRWIEVRKKVYGVATHFVEKRVHPDDVVVPCRGGFILIFAHLSAEESRDRLEAISQELNLFFLGDQILKHLDITTRARKVDAAEFAQFIQKSANVEPDEEASGGRRRRRADEDEAAAVKAAKWQEGDSRRRTEGSLSQKASSVVPEKIARWVDGETEAPGTDSGLTEERRTAQKKSASWQDGPEKSVREASHQYRDAPEREAAPDVRFAQSADAAPQSAGKPAAWRGSEGATKRSEAPRAPVTALAEASTHWDDIIFKPSWDAKENSITSNVCLARRVKDGVVYYGRDTLMGSGAFELHGELDRAVAIAAQRGYQQVHAQGESCDICIPVHYDTIRAVSDRVSYFSILQVVPQHLRRHFFLRVDHIPAGAPISQMEELFRSMKCFGSNLLASIPLDQTDLSRFEGCRIDMFGSALPCPRRAGPVSDDQIAALGRRAKAADKMSARTYLTGVDNFDELVSGVSVGVRLFTGEAIGSDTALPMPRRPVPFSELLERSEAMANSPPELRRSAG